MSQHVIPVLQRRRAWPPEWDAPIKVVMGPGIEVGFGIDIGPAIAHVGAELLGQWGVSASDVRDQAIANLRRHAEAEKLVPSIRELVGDVPVYWYESGGGWASALLLTPDELCRRVPEESCLVLAPMRDLILSVPVDTDPGFAMMLRDEFAFEDPNGLDLPVFRFSQGTVSILVPGTAEEGVTTRVH